MIYEGREGAEKKLITTSSLYQLCRQFYTFNSNLTNTVRHTNRLKPTLSPFTCRHLSERHIREYNARTSVVVESIDSLLLRSFGNVCILQKKTYIHFSMFLEYFLFGHGASNHSLIRKTRPHCRTVCLIRLIFICCVCVFCLFYSII